MTTYYTALVGVRVRKRRHAVGMTQAQLAEAVGLSRTSIVNIEKGEQRVVIDYLRPLADALGCSVGALVPEHWPYQRLVAHAATLSSPETGQGQGDET